MDSLNGKWISPDGFRLTLQSRASGSTEGTYHTSLMGRPLVLGLHGVGLRQGELLTFVLVVECGPCRMGGWTGEIDLFGTVDHPTSSMNVQWLATGSSAHPGGAPRVMRGNGLLFKSPYPCHWEPAFTSESYAPHTLLVYERSQRLKKREGAPGPALRPARRKKKKP